MYRYDAVDQRIVDERVAQFRDQTARFLAGRLSEDEYRPLRLQNGLYIQRHAPMLRIAIPYGLLSTRQLRMIADISRRYDKSYAHFTTRQNVQLNWPALERVPDILADLATVEMHAIQTSGSCIRNVTTDHLAGVAADEIVDPRPYAEMMRQWSTLHPEFGYLPRKFKIAYNGARDDRAASAVHDLAFDVYKGADGEVLLRVKVGGGLGRTPRIAIAIREDLPWRHMLTYTEAIMRAYNRFGRRDNLYKSRIKILVEAIGADKFAEEVESDFIHLVDGPSTLTEEERARVAACFTDPPYLPDVEADADLSDLRVKHRRFDAWLRRNVTAHKRAGYAAVTLSLKRVGPAPGDATAAEIDAAADLADRYAFGEIRVSHHQNLILADVARRDLFALWQDADAAGLAQPNIGLATDIIACPGGDFCSLANARSIPLSLAIQNELEDRQEEIGELAIKISGCINACGHHHVGHIGVIGVDKNGEEWFQVLVGGRSDANVRIGEILGKAVKAEEIPALVSRLIDLYLAERASGERFIDTVARIGVPAFKAAAYPEAKAAA